MDYDEIDDVICDIMMKDGPDGHIDGHEKITDFIVSIICGDGEEWIKKYREPTDTKVS